MDTVEEFELRVSIAAEDAKASGFIQTYLALLEVLRQSRIIRARTSKYDNAMNAQPERISLGTEPQPLH